MAMDSVLTPSQIQPEPATEVRKHPRIWPAVGLVAFFWIASFLMTRLELVTFIHFLSYMAISAVLTLGFALWWLLNRRIRRKERLLVFAVAITGGALLSFTYHYSLGLWMLIFMLPPYVCTAWTIWLLLAQRAAARTRFVGLLSVVLLCEAAFTLIRWDGINGDKVSEYHWRWTPTAEELYQAELAQRPQETTKVPAGTVLALQPGDWPGFRGPERDGVIRGARIATDWDKHPPDKRWRQRVGPGWSSLAVVDGRVFTQEQRGSAEAVVCLDAATGGLIWSHEDETRFWEGVSGAGPRATPQFADGRLYALGAKGILNCLDAANGERKWSRNIAAESGAKTPLWGFCGSPLVVGDVVVVFAGGDGEKQLLAYRAASGEPAWTASVGRDSYSSPHRAVLNGTEQILFWSDRGLFAVDPASGKIRWQHDAVAPGAPRSLQPNIVGAGQVLVSSEADLGTACLDVKHDKDAWAISERWRSRQLKPSFNDFVTHNGSIYGFDGAIFCCIDLQTGERRWREGRYGYGQVLLLADQSLLLVAAENGQVVLLAANPDEHTELGRFPAIRGKTWNHPAFAQGRLYVRNGEEIACYDLQVDKR